MMRDDFCAFILTHGRPDRVYTYDTLRKAGYTGKVYIVIDDEDKTADQYRERYGDKVLQFSKAKIAQTFDEGDNFGDRRAIIYARNACWDLAQQVGCRFFVQFDDDYVNFNYRFDHLRRPGYWACHSLDSVMDAYLNYLSSTAILTLAFAKNGDIFGGKKSGNLDAVKTKRKAMNSFFCDASKRFCFFGRINEDVNTYVTLGGRGSVFLTPFMFALGQRQTQSNPGGMTELYLDSGTYMKSFYSVMYAPSCVHVFQIQQYRHDRLHHKIDWNAAVPKIIRETHRKAA